ncbi:hypothetical protein [Actinokineospora alba]|nr:hypothetical protein [Actinokineospora alba]
MKRREPNRGDGREMIGHTIGNALVVHPRNALRAETRDLALRLAPDPEYQLVVLDLPLESSVAVWEQAARLLPRKRCGLRLIIGGRSRETTALAGRWLCERLGRTVIAPDGSVMPGVDGTLFVDSGWSSGWMRFQPGKPPQLDGKRFPRPLWEEATLLSEILPTSAGGVAEPLPGGVWLRPRGPEAALSRHRKRLVESLPSQPDVCVVVVGCPDTPPVTTQDIVRFWSWAPEPLRAMLRLVKFGPITLPGDTRFGQAAADALGQEVICYTGIPFGSRTEPDVFTLREDGTLGWRALAEEMSYLPAEPGLPAPPSVLTAYRPPFIGVDEVTRAVFQYSPHAVLEVVPSGLWLRPPTEVGHAAAVRAAEPDATRHVVLYEEGQRHLRELAEDVLGRLDPATRYLSRLVPVDALMRQRLEVGGRALVAVPEVDDRGVASERPAFAADVSLSLETVTMSPENLRPERLMPKPAIAGPAAAVVEQDVVAPPVAPAEPPAVPVEQAAPASVHPEVGAPVDSPAAGVPFAVVEPPVALNPIAARPAGVTAIFSSVGPMPTEVPTTELVPSPAPADTSLSGVTSGDVPAPETDQAAPSPNRAPLVAALQPTPAAGAAALIPTRGLDEERTWLRRALSREYGAMSNSVTRVLSEHPGFQGAIERSAGAVLTDAVAIRLYLSDAGDDVDLPLRSGATGPHVPFARCVVAGLSRLPSHRGATMFAATPTAAEWELYRSRKFFTEWGFVHALSAPCARQQQEHEVDVLLWSMTARRTKLLEPEKEPTIDRVLFVPGTSFKVLDLAEPRPGERGLVLLRELATGEIDESGRVDTNRASLDELAVNSLRRQLDSYADAQGEVRVPPVAAARFSTLPGLVRTTATQEKTR